MRKLVPVVAAVALTAALGCEYPPDEDPVVEWPDDPVEEMQEDAMIEDPIEEEREMDWTIESSAWEDGGTIPEKYTADGANVSPPLSFEDLLDGTVEIALICHDPDAPREGGFTHWVVYGMAADIGGLPEDLPAEQTVDEPRLNQGENSAGEIGYMGPAPPPGDPHRYQFRGYALSEALELAPGATKAELEATIDGNVIGEAMFEGLYGRN